MPTPVDEPGIVPPNNLDRREKREFRRIVAARADLARPLRLAEVDTAVDYVRTRHRIAVLEILADHRRKAEARTHPSSFLQTVRALETATATSRRLAGDLGLILNADAAPAQKDRAP